MTDNVSMLIGPNFPTAVKDESASGAHCEVGKNHVDVAAFLFAWVVLERMRKL